MSKRKRDEYDSGFLHGMIFGWILFVILIPAAEWLWSQWAS